MVLRRSTYVFSRWLAAGICVSLLLMFVPVLYAEEDSVERRRAELEKQLEELIEEIAGQQSLLDGKRQERVSFERDVTILEAQIRKAQLSIEARNLSIRQLGGEIGQKEQTIGGLTSKLSREKESLAQLLRKTNEIDNYSLVEIVLGNQNLSAFFEDLDAFNVIKGKLQESFIEIELTKQDTQAQKELLEDKQVEEVELRTIQELQKREIEVREAEKQRIVDITKGVETAYQNIISAKQRTAAEIRAELFTLRGTAAIPFGEALDLANLASQKTGVRPAFILGVIAQESKLGENIGQCNLPEDPPKYKWQNIMKAPRDTVPYLEITSSLGLDPNRMPLSCPPGYGYGGAMGPAQFIPSTWILYKDRIAKLTGNNPPNPWFPGDAFIASALLLMDNGADHGTRGAERLAALRYFAGWRNAEKPAYAFYGDGVLDLADKYQQQIDILSSS